jgi:cephalosporin-C deacetylase-like acetyl esterase
MPITQAANVLAPFFIKHGYAFLYPFRGGHGSSASQAPFMQDVLRREEESKGKDARRHLQFVLLTTDQLDDAMAALAFLKTVPGIDPQRVAVAGHSFGGEPDVAGGGTGQDTTRGSHICGSRRFLGLFAGVARTIDDCYPQYESSDHAHTGGERL